MKKTAMQLVEEASSEIVTLNPSDALKMQQSGEAIIVDIRDIRELGREGKIPGAVHAPRGMLEFWVDPESPYHRDVFAQNGKTYVFVCAGALRSALATRDMQNMGLAPVAHIEGGFGKWRDEGLPVDAPTNPPEKKQD